jgi:hypothetical protein
VIGETRQVCIKKKNGKKEKVYLSHVRFSLALALALAIAQALCAKAPKPYLALCLYIVSVLAGVFCPTFFSSFFGFQK